MKDNMRCHRNKKSWGVLRWKLNVRDRVETDWKRKIVSKSLHTDRPYDSSVCTRLRWMFLSQTKPLSNFIDQVINWTRRGTWGNCVFSSLMTESSLYDIKCVYFNNGFGRRYFGRSARVFYNYHLNNNKIKPFRLCTVTIRLSFDNFFFFLATLDEKRSYENRAAANACENINFCLVQH